MAQFMKRKEKGDAAAQKVQTVTVEQTDPGFAKKFAALAEFLALEAWEDGTERERGAITWFYEEGAFKACVNDRDAGLKAFVTKSTFQGLLESIEKGLAADSLDWRKDSWKGQVKKRRS